MEPNDILKEIDKLELSEKLILVEDIWDSIARNNAQLPMPQWQKLELKRRYESFKNGDLELHDWETVHKEIRSKYQ